MGIHQLFTKFCLRGWFLTENQREVVVPLLLDTNQSYASYQWLRRNVTERDMENGKWRVGNGEWETENGKWRMGNGEWAVGNG